MASNEKITVSIDADTTEIEASIERLEKISKEFGATFSTALTDSITQGKNFENTLRSIGASLAKVALSNAIKPLENIFGNFVGSIFSGGNAAKTAPNANSDVYGPVRPLQFAKGGLIAAPSYFNYQGATAVMGEAGAEAILPLSRGPDGKLGVATGQSSGSPANIVFNVNATDADSFKRSESQISAMLARAVSRGRRNL